MHDRVQIFPLFVLSVLRTPLLPPPQDVGVTHVEAEGEFYKNKVALEHYKHFEASFPTEHYPVTQELSQF